MEEFQKKFIWLVFILPGFLTVTVIGAIADLGDAGEFSLTLYSLALTFVDVAIAVLISAAIVGLLALVGVALEQVGRLLIFVAVTLVISVVIGLVVGIASEQGTVYATLRQIPFFEVLNKRSQARPLIFLLRQNTGGQLDIEGDGRPRDKVGEAYLRVYLDDDVIYEGWPEFYDSKPTEIYLSPACRMSEDAAGAATARKIPGPGAVIPESQVKHAILLERDASPCWHLYFPEGAKPAG